MKIFKTRIFDSWSKKVISDVHLRKAIYEMQQGLYDARLGGGVFKKRIAINNRGKCDGVRTIIAFSVDDKAFFIYGYSKNKRSNINKQEEDALKKLASVYFLYDENQIKQAINLGELIEVIS